MLNMSHAADSFGTLNCIVLPRVPHVRKLLQRLWWWCLPGPLRVRQPKFRFSNTLGRNLQRLVHVGVTSVRRRLARQGERDPTTNLLARGPTHFDLTLEVASILRLGLLTGTIYKDEPCIKLGKRKEPVRKLCCAQSSKLVFLQ